MEMNAREIFTVVHGMGFGAVFLLAFAGGLAGLYSLRPEWATVGGIRERVPRLEWGTSIMAVVAWLTVISGTWLVYIWYRAPAPQGLTSDALREFPRNFLLASPTRALWHTFGMEWKEHVAWISPFLATAVAFGVIYYGPRLVHEPKIRKALIVLFTLSFVAAGVAGAFGAFINKVAPIL